MFYFHPSFRPVGALTSEQIQIGAFSETKQKPKQKKIIMEASLLAAAYNYFVYFNTNFGAFQFDF